jgi:hypothetical protein
MNSISLESFDVKRISEHISLGESVYSSPEVINSEHILWKHLNNPFGASTSVSLRNGSNVLFGRSFIQPRTFWVTQFKFCRGATITDLVINPEERNASTLIAMTRAIKSPEGFDVIIHTSNDNSDPIYRKLFKFPIAFTLAATGLPIRISNIIKPYLKSLVLCDVADFLISPWRGLLHSSAFIMGLVSNIKLSVAPSDSVRAEIFEEFRQHAGPHFERNKQFLTWRFTEGPIFNGQVEWVWIHGDCLGYLSFKRVSLGGLNVLVILDAVLRRRLTLSEAIALKFIAARLAIDHACDAIFTLANIENPALKWIKGFPFLNIPDHHLPHSTPIFIHAQNEFEVLRSKNDIFFTLADLDYF